jgi:hypothetical protein
LFCVSRGTLRESEKPDDIEVAVFMKIADEARVEFAEARIVEIPLPGLSGFRDATADDFDEIATVNGIAEE